MNLVRDTLTGVVSAGPALILGLLIVLAGAAFGWCLGLYDRFLLVAASAPIALGGLLVAAQLLAWLHIEVPVGWLILVTLVLSAMVGLLVKAWHSRVGKAAVVPRQASSVEWPPWIGALLGAGLAMVAWLPGIRDPSLPPQNNDDIWHGYLTARLQDMPTIGAANGAPVLTDAAEPSVFYPNAAHLLASVLDAATPAGIPMAINATWCVVVGVLLPFGSVALIRALLPDRPVAIVAAGLLAPVVTSFPYLVNGLWPYAMSLALVPVWLALLVHRGNGDHVGRLSLPIALGAVALFMSHPAGAVVAAVAAAFVVAEVLFRAPCPRATAARLVAPALLSVAFVAPWLVVASDRVGHDPTPSPLGREFTELARMALFLETPWTTSGQPAIAVLAAAGVLAAVFRRGRSAGLAMTYLLFLFSLVALWQGFEFAVRLSDPWYGEWHRVAAVAGLFAGLVAAVGIDALASLARRAAARLSMSRKAATATAVVLLAALAIPMLQYMARAQSILRTAWSQPELVTEADLALFDELDRQVEDSGSVLSDWGSGATWMLAIEDVEPLIPYAYSVNQAPTVGNLLLRPADLDQDAALCAEAVHRGVTHVLVKNVAGPQSNPSFADAVRSRPDLYALTYEGPSGSIFSIDPDALAECMAASPG